MKKIALLFTVISCCSQLSFAQSIFSAEVDTIGPWTFDGRSQLTFSQLALKNWQGGGENTLAGQGFLNLIGGYNDAKHIWDNKLDLGYGIVRQGKGAHVPFRKSDDLMKYMTQYGRRLSPSWLTVALADFQSVFTPGYNFAPDSTGTVVRKEKTAAFFSPAYLLTSAGLEYKPSKVFFAMLAPVSGKFTFVSDDSMAAVGAYGVDTGKNFRAELGALLKSVVDAELGKNVKFLSDLSLFANYKTLDAIDVTWRGQMIFSINKFLIAKISTDLIYDEDIVIIREDKTTGPGLQIKEAFSIGFQYNF